MRVRRPAIRARLLFALVLLGVNAARADIIHLKNGATIMADSWEVSGDRLVIRQGAGRIAVPRSEVVRIEPSARASPAPMGPPAAPPAAGQDDTGSVAPAPAGSAGDGDAPVSDDQILRAVEDLKRRINDYPLAR